MSAYANGFGKIANRGRIAPFWEKRPYRRGPDLTVGFGQFEQMFVIVWNVKILCRFCAGLDSGREK